MRASGLLAVVRGVRAAFKATDVSATVSVGWAARDRQDDQGPGGANRVVFIPGDFEGAASPPRSLKAGTIDRDGAQNHVGLNPRLKTNAWWHYPVTMSVWAVDPERATDEEAQIFATEDLVEQAIDAVLHAVDPETGQGVGFANIEAMGDPSWTRPPGELSFGRELTVPFTLLVPLFTQNVALGHPGARVVRQPAA